MALNPSIILAGQQFDLAGSMGAGNQLAAQTNQLRDQNALRDVYRTQGAGILQGNQGSLNALAAVDPNLAINAQGGVLQNQTATRQLEVLNAQEKRAIAEAARNMDEAQKAQAAAAVKQEVLQFIAAPTPEIFDQMVTQAGKPELAGMWANRQVLGAQYVSSVEEALALSQGPAAPELPDSIQALQFRAQAAGLQPGTPEYASFMERGGTKVGPDTAITVNSGGGSDRQVFDAVAASAESARSAVSGLRALQEAKSALEGGIISGAFADNVLALQKIGASFGVVDPTAIQNTETFRSAIAPQVAAMIKATVGSAQLSNADREFAEKAAGGNINLDEGTIKRLVDIMERGSRASVESHLDRLNAVYPETPEGTYRRERALFNVSVPEPVGAVPGSGSPGTPPAPAGSTPAQPQGAALPPDLQSIFDKYSIP
jgi:hypothetical protein